MHPQAAGMALLFLQRLEVWGTTEGCDLWCGLLTLPNPAKKLLGDAAGTCLGGASQYVSGLHLHKIPPKLRPRWDSLQG